MRQSLVAVLLVLLAASFCIAAPQSAVQPDEASLLAAWEGALRAEPTTEVLQSAGGRLYRFKTRLFPFDGEMKVLNVLIQDFGGEEEPLPGFAMGSVEVELVGFTQEQMSRYARSYSYWYQLHTLYFDHAAGRWLSAKEYRSALMARYSASGRGSFTVWLARNYFLVIMALLALFLWWVARKSGRQVRTALSHQDEAMEITRRSIALSEKAVQQNDESIRLLQEILRELQGRK